MQRKKGFTLLELLAVIIILALLAMIAIPMILRMINKAKEGALNTIKVSMVEAAKIYTLTNEEYFHIENGEKNISNCLT